tara:strand:+ start:1247 stop:1756 length:510 start_codon:yes stop_codon:yes gene_type:complete
MMTNFDDAMVALLKHEGGFVNHPADPGGMTNLGVTKKVWEEWVGHPVSEEDMRALTREKVSPLYKAKYWNIIQGDKLPHGVDLCVFDCAVNSGTKRAVKLLQRAIGVEDDGILGNMTLAACEALEPDLIIQRFSEERLSFLQALPTFATFGKGWTRRVAEVEAQAQNLA